MGTSICIGQHHYLNRMVEGKVHPNFIEYVTDVILNSSTQAHFVCGYRMIVNILHTLKVTLKLLKYSKNILKLLKNPQNNLSASQRANDICYILLLMAL